LHLHLSGIEYGAKGERQHIPLNESDFAYRELLQALIEVDARGTVGVEAPEPFHVADALTLQATYRRLRAIHEGSVVETLEDEAT
jgi:deoxyribonuclease-4